MSVVVSYSLMDILIMERYIGICKAPKLPGTANELEILEHLLRGLCAGSHK